MKEMFNKIAKFTANALGTPWAFLAAVVFTILWAVSGPIFHYSEAWQLVVNTVTSIVTFLMVFLIQATQNRDTLATQLKLDELLRAVEGARTGLINLEALSDEDLSQLEEEFAKLRGQSASRELPMSQGDGSAATQH